jgi:glutathione S-transferase
MNDRPLIYTTPNTRSGTIGFMDEELGGVCDFKVINIRAGDGRSPEFRALNPMGKVPTLSHRGVVVTEAAAICAYLADAFPKAGLAPATDDPVRGAYYRWMFFAPSVIEPMMLDKLGGVARENAGAVGHGDPQRVQAAIEHALSKGPWLLGEKFSAADVVFGSTLNFATMFGAIEKAGVIGAFVDRVTSRPAFARMKAKNAEQAKSLAS